ncbi:hypothetical protein B0H34DRAFT_169097 [Crassisporium funariophilum]|nr:hypothetical protein B0H34DRAFT_169097 [Crassisporium funariophilum]
MVMNYRPQQHEEDQDSLFGSPPSSPRIAAVAAGRAASPSLALPSASYAESRLSTSTDTQNVGTIALPGSHPYSELPINPLALSLNHGAVYRPPALQPQGQASQPQWANAQWANDSRPSSSGSTTVRPSSRTSTSSTPTTTTKPKKRSRQPSHSQTQNGDEFSTQPRGLEFTLPDPSAPRPTHFLRNQHNLLGKAGLVAGVKPATITHVRGATPSNPIIVEDEDAPLLGRNSSFRDPSQRYIESSLLSAPSNQDIVSVLIGQKDIFPVLESLLKLIAGGNAITPRTTPPPTGFERRGASSQQPVPTETNQASNSNPTSNNSGAKHTVKRRKLNRVPAGASDWDVPYPFPQGEGPDAYHKTWERERGKHLISQLIKLIKGAARKAATKNYLQQEKARRDEYELQQRRAMEALGFGGGLGAGMEMEMAKMRERDVRVNGYYKPETVMYGLEEDQARVAMKQVFDVLTDTSNDVRVWKTTTAAAAAWPSLAAGNSSVSQPALKTGPTAAMQSQSQNQNLPSTSSTAPLSFDNLISSLVAAAPPDQTTMNPSSASTYQQNIPTSNPSISNGPSNTAVDGGIDQTLFDTWMSFLETFPVSFDGVSDGQTQSVPIGSGPSSHESTPALDDFATTGNIGYGGGDDMDALIASMMNSMPNQNLGSTSTTGQAPSSSISTMSVQSPLAETSTATIGNHLIDPGLLALSIPTFPSMGLNLNSDASVSIPDAASPIPSMSSYGSTDPATPNSANWEMSMPDVFMGGEGGMDMDGTGTGGGGGGGGGYRGGGQGGDAGLITADTLKELGILTSMDKEGQTAIGGGGTALVDKGKGKEIWPPLEASPATPVATTVAVAPPASLSTFHASLVAPPFTPTPFSTGASKSKPKTGADIAARKARRDDILTRAGEKRRKVQEELDRVKMQLWETTIEQAALVHLVKRCEGKEAEAREEMVNTAA